MKEIREQCLGEDPRLSLDAPPRLTRQPAAGDSPQEAVPPCFVPQPHAAAPRPVLRIAAAAQATLAWAAARAGAQCCTLWGLLELDEAGGPRLAEAILARQSSGTARSIPDPAWRAELLEQLRRERGIAPWQLACWIQTRPPGLALPSPADRAAFAAALGREPLAILLIATADQRFAGELSAWGRPLAGAAPLRLSSPLAFRLEAPAARLTQSEGQRMEEAWDRLVTLLPERPGNPAPWPWNSPTQLWPAGDPDFYGEEPYLPPAWVEAWRQARLDLSEEDLADYLRDFLWRGADGREQVIPLAFELEQVAQFFDNEAMSVWAAALLRDRLRREARRRGWLADE